MSNQKTAIVTGGGRGIGRGIATSLGELGWNVVVNYRSNDTSAKEAGELIEELGGKGLAVQADIGKTADREKLVKASVEAFGKIDLLVNNAGMGPPKRLDVLSTTEESYDLVMGVNLKGPFFLTQVVANTMLADIAAGKYAAMPKIVNIGSISGYTSSPSRGEYCISKAGMGMVTLLFADRLADDGINVYEIRPGIIATDLTSVVKEKYDKLIGDGLTPIKRWGEPGDIAKAVLAIANDLFPFSTGEVFNVDGGFHMHRL